jgi:hypothetical protein
MSRRGARQAASSKGSAPDSGDGLDSRVLDPGWAGELSDGEVEYIQRELKRSRRLWRRWGYLGALLKGVTIPAATLRRIAKHGLK